MVVGALLLEVEARFKDGMSIREATRLGVVSAVSNAATERRIVYSVASFLLLLQGIYRHLASPRQIPCHKLIRK